MSGSRRVEETIGKLAGRWASIDILINNAGLARSQSSRRAA
jgi:NADP-dependent 3-hydroxy acid dehydrogenase YdfG